MELRAEEIAGSQLQVAVGGEGQPLLYLHSAAGESFLWLDLLNGLAEQREVHAPLYPGFFGSQGLEQIHDMEDLAFQMLAFVDERGWDSVDVMGCSLGGWVALELAARYPERVSRLVLASSVGIRLPDVPMADLFALQLGQEDKMRELVFHDPNHPLAQLMIPTFEDLDDEQLMAFIQAMAATAKVGWNPYMHDPRLEPLLRRITAETLVVWGESDRIVPPPYGEALAQRIAGARLVKVPECGHAIWFEKPQELLAAALEHLGAAAPAVSR